jgi:hypothetical protein
MARIWDRLLYKSLTWADRIRPDHSQDSFEIVDGSRLVVGEFRAAGCMRGMSVVHTFEFTVPIDAGPSHQPVRFRCRLPPCTEMDPQPLQQVLARCFSRATIARRMVPSSGTWSRTAASLAAPVLAVGERNYDESAWLVAYVTRDEWLQQCQDELFKLRPHLSSKFATTMTSETGILTVR